MSPNPYLQCAAINPSTESPEQAWGAAEQDQVREGNPCQGTDDDGSKEVKHKRCSFCCSIPSRAVALWTLYCGRARQAPNPREL